ncbi:hypothetical protein RI367_006338 [Sorochytrium milnesiophthora]
MKSVKPTAAPPTAATALGSSKLILKSQQLTGDRLLERMREHDATLIKHLDVSDNQLDSLAGLEAFRQLVVLNVSGNRIHALSPHLLKLTHLGALIAKDNFVRRVENLAACTQLNTLVLSHNRLESLDGSALASCTQLKKLSVTHNPLLKHIPDLSANKQLKELRLSNCAITKVPESIAGNQALEIVDLGSNQLGSYTDVVNLAALPKLVSLTLQGNPVCGAQDKKADQEYRDKVTTLLPTLRVLDNVRFDEKYLQRKLKREALDKKKNRKQRPPAPEEETEKADAASVPAKRLAEPSETGNANKRMKAVPPAVKEPTTRLPSTMSLSDGPSVEAHKAKAVPAPAPDTVTTVAQPAGEIQLRSGVVAVQEVKRKARAVQEFNPEQLFLDDSASKTIGGWD